jgi:molybdate transport system ATP-binding protein
MTALSSSRPPSSAEVADSGGAPFRVRFENAAFRVGTRRILRGTSWTIRPGEQWLIWGPNGSGKTTLAGAVAGEIPVVEGRRRYGYPPGGMPLVSRVSFDEHSRMVAREDLMDLSRDFSGATERQLTPFAVIAEVASPESALELLRRVGIGRSAFQPVRTLSAGEMRKLLVARALAREPGLLILDEPFDSLDDASRRRLAGTIGDLMAMGIQILLVTHRREEILPGITHVIALSGGTVVYQGPLDRWQPSSPDRASEMGDRGAHRGEGQSRGSGADDLLLHFDGVSVRFGHRTVFDGLHWRVRRGEKWLVSGPNGSGKSTLVGLVTGDHPQAYANRIRLFGRIRGTGETIWEIKQRLGLVSSDLQVRYRRELQAIDVVVSGFFDSIGLYRMASDRQRVLAAGWLERMGIGHLSDRRFNRISQGEQRMVLLARAMVKAPELLVLDEPCQGLDVDNRRRILEITDQVAEGKDTSLIFVTHHRDERPGCITHELRLSGGEQ